MTKPPTSRYEQVADALRTAIVQGHYRPGEQLPSTSVLAEQYNLSFPTINKAIRLLATQGLVTVTHGKGTKVRERRPVMQQTSRYVVQHPSGTRANWKTETNKQGLSSSQTIRSVEKVTPLPEISGYLELDDGDLVVARRRVLYLDGEPAQLADSYYPSTIADRTEIANNQPISGGTVAALERLGYPPVRFVEQLNARMPTDEEYRLLEMAPGTPIQRHTRVTYAEGDRPTEYTETVMTGDRHVMSYEFPAQL